MKGYQQMLVSLQWMCQEERGIAVAPSVPRPAEGSGLNTPPAREEEPSLLSNIRAIFSLFWAFLTLKRQEWSCSPVLCSHSGSAPFPQALAVSHPCCIPKLSLAGNSCALSHRSPKQKVPRFGLFLPACFKILSWSSQIQHFLVLLKYLQKFYVYLCKHETEVGWCNGFCSFL